MIERRLVGRRFVDFHPDAAHPSYPIELERRRRKRRAGDRHGAPCGPDALLPGARRRPRVLFSGVLKCPQCQRELRRVRNLSGEGRKYLIAEFCFAAPASQVCSCGAAKAALEWVLQAGTE